MLEYLRHYVSDNPNQWDRVRTTFPFRTTHRCTENLLGTVRSFIVKDATTIGTRCRSQLQGHHHNGCPLKFFKPLESVYEHSENGNRCHTEELRETLRREGMNTTPESEDGVKSLRAEGSLRHILEPSYVGTKSNRTVCGYRRQ